MVKKICLLILVSCSLESCFKTVTSLNMERIPYTGKELRIDGYYYSDIEVLGKNYPSVCMEIAVFYQNGFCIHTGIDLSRRGLSAEDKNLLEYIEKNILCESFIARLKSTPSDIGVFQFNGQSIEFEVWNQNSPAIIPYHFYGKILNDSTFIIEKYVNCCHTHVFPDNFTYRFKQYSPKPDSTNRFIK